MLCKNIITSLNRCGIIRAFILTLISCVGVSLVSGQDAVDWPEYHPFRSAEAKEEYLQLYDDRAKSWPVPSETKMVETSYGQTFVRISGPVNALPLVLLPGGSATSLMWIPNVEALSGHYRTYAVDNIYDVGRSVYTRTMQSSNDLVAWLDELFSALALGDNINLVGLSYGGWLTSQYALHFPNRLNKIVLLAPAATILPFSPEFLKRAMLLMTPSRESYMNVFTWLMENAVKNDEVKQGLVERAVDDILVALKCFKFKMLVPPTVLKDKELESIKVPTLFLVGENEKIYSAQQAVQRLNEVAPQIETETLPNCGHDLTIVQTEMVDKRILEFLRRS